MIHELREYTLELADAEPYFDLFRNVGMRVRGNEYGRLVGSWVVDNEHVRFLHIWEYESLADRADKRLALSRQKAWTDEFLPEAVKRVSTQSISILNPVAGRMLNPAYLADEEARVLQVFRCRLGKAGTISAALRAKHLHADGIWIGEFPDPNAVLMLVNATDELVETEEFDELGLLVASTRRVSSGPYQHEPDV
jgi:hypothetical protein